MSAPLDQDTNVLASELRAGSPSSGAEPPLGGAAPEASFAALYDGWFDEVSRWVRALGARPSECDDLVQDVFLVVHRRLESFDGQNVAGWLYQIARHKVRDHRRLQWIKHLFGRSSVPLTDAMFQTEQGPLQELETKRKRELLEQLLDTLSTDQRSAFVLFEIEGKSGEEIATLSGVSVNAVWARIHKARRKLQEQAERCEKRRAGGGRR